MWLSIDQLPENDPEYWHGPFIINVISPDLYPTVWTGYRYMEKWHWAENKKPISKDFIVTHYMLMPLPPFEEPDQDQLWNEIREDMTGGAFAFPRPDIVDNWAKSYTIIRKL